MSEERPTYGDEIDLFELFEKLWDGKWLISTFVALASLIGLCYSQVAQPEYEVSVPFSFNIHSVGTQQICGSNIGCMESKTTKRLLTLLGGSWSKDKKRLKLSFSASSHPGSSTYELQVDAANTALSSDIYKEATNELNFIHTELTDALLGTERVAMNMLNARRVIQSVDDGQSAINFGSVSVVKSSPKVPLILALSVLLGGIIGVLFILVRDAIKKRKELLAGV